MFNFPLDEIKRKSFHLLIFFYIFGYWLLPLHVVLYVFGSIIIAVVLIELARLRMPSINLWVLKNLGGVHRESEVKKFSGLPWTLSGSFLTMLIFPNKAIVLVSFLYLALGDAVAALIGKKWGKYFIVGKKTLEGSLACFVVCFIIGLFFLSWPFALFGAFFATVVELIPWPLNDNFWMPLATASVLSLLTVYFNIF